MYYNYCPECGTESEPFVKEPAEGTPIVCRYCKTVYGYHTRYWDQQWIVIKVILVLLFIAFVCNECRRPKFGSDEWLRQQGYDVPAREVVKNRGGVKEAEVKPQKDGPGECTIRIDGGEKIHLESLMCDRFAEYPGGLTTRIKNELVNLHEGLGPEFRWGSHPHDGEHVGACTIGYRLEGNDMDWAEFTYLKGKGLAGFSLVKSGLRDGEKMVDVLKKVGEEYLAKPQRQIIGTRHIKLVISNYNMAIFLVEDGNLLISVAVMLKSSGVPCDWVRVSVRHRKLDLTVNYEQLVAKWKKLGFREDKWEKPEEEE